MKKDDEVREERSPYGEQDAWGNSVDALRANLKLSYLERLRRGEAHSKDVEKLRGLLNRRR